jgi:hypothetical protein
VFPRIVQRTVYVAKYSPIGAVATGERKRILWGHMPKWVRWLKSGALTAGTVVGAGVLVAAGGGAVGASGPRPADDAPMKTIVTLPAGCTHTPTVKILPTGTRMYQGFLNAKCGSTNKIFYLQRSPKGVWALRTTPYTTANDIGAVAVDSTGTYVVFNNSKHQLLLGKRQSNGTFTTQRALGSRFDSPNHPSIIAQNGEYWVMWDDDFPHATSPVRRGLWETKTIGVDVTDNPVGKHYHNYGTLIRRSNGAYQLLTFDQLTAGDPQSGVDGTGQVSLSDRAGTGWTGAHAVYPEGIKTHGSSQYAEFNGLLYGVADWACQPGTANAGTGRLNAAIGGALPKGSSPFFGRIELDAALDQGCTSQGATDTTANGTLLQWGTTTGTTIYISDNKYVWASYSGGTFDGVPVVQLVSQPANTVEVALTISYGHIQRIVSQTNGSTTTLILQEASPGP